MTGEPPRLRRLAAADVSAVRRVGDGEVYAAAERIVGEVERGGEPALRRLAERFDRLPAGAPLVHDRDACGRAAAGLPTDQLRLLQRVHARIAHFADAQRQALRPLRIPFGAAGTMGHDVVPVQSAGCYAPGGRYPLPSSVLMTVTPARVAGVERVVVASPDPQPITLAAAAVAGADAVLAAGGAQAIAALALGVAVPACDVICGPGNAWVTAAKQIVSGRIAGIDMLAGPSELVVLADSSADAEAIAADLLAQAEHDEQARAVLVTDSAALADAVENAVQCQLADLPTAAIARAALGRNGACVLVADLDEGAAVCDRLAPEHLQLLVSEPERVRPRLRHFGALFVGHGAAEVLADYGAGPNHVLPTAGGARAGAGLSVFRFLRTQTWIRADAAPADVVADAAALAELEGLAGHARAARRRG